MNQTKHPGRPVMRFESSCDPGTMDRLASYGAAEDDLETEPDEEA
jgi:hypothetical protein